MKISKSIFPTLSLFDERRWNLDYIEIDRRLVVHRSLPRLHFHGYSKVTFSTLFCTFAVGYIVNALMCIQVTSATSKLQNTGRALVVNVETEGRLSGGPLPEEYVLLQVLIFENQIEISTKKI